MSSGRIPSSRSSKADSISLNGIPSAEGLELAVGLALVGVYVGRGVNIGFKLFVGEYVGKGLVVGLGLFVGF